MLSCMSRLGNKSVDYRYCSCFVRVGLSDQSHRNVIVPNIFVFVFNVFPKMENHEITKMFSAKKINSLRFYKIKKKIH